MLRDLRRPRDTNPTEPIIGNWLSAQRQPIASSTQRVGTRLTRTPVATDENANSKKKLEPINPNWRGLSSSSCIIGTAAIPITALSAKLITMNKNNRATISQASLGVSEGWAVATPPRRWAVSSSLRA